MTFGQRLRILRNDSKLTQEQLAKKLDVTKSNISKYESDSLEPNIRVLKLLSSIFNVSVDCMIGAGLFEEKSFALLIAYKDMILARLCSSGVITTKLYAGLRKCNNLAYVTFISTIITDLTGDEKGIQYSYLETVGNIGIELYESLTVEQKDEFRYIPFEEIPRNQMQADIIDKIDNLPYEQQQKIRDYINMSYEVEKASSVAAGDKYSNEGKKSSPLSGTEGERVAGA